MFAKKLSVGQRLQETLLLALLLCSLYSAVALFSADARDPSWLHVTSMTVVYNRGGLLGAWLADTLLFICGLFSYTLPILGTLLSMMIWYRQIRVQPSSTLMRLLCFIGALLMLSGTCGLLSISLGGLQAHLPAGAGGVIGSLLIQALLPWCSHLGTMLILLGIWAIGLMLLTGCSWLILLSGLYQRIIKGIQRLTIVKTIFIRMVARLKHVKRLNLALLPKNFISQITEQTFLEKKRPRSRQEPELERPLPITSLAITPTIELPLASGLELPEEQIKRHALNNSSTALSRSKGEDPQRIDQVSKEYTTLPSLELLTLAACQLAELSPTELQQTGRMIEERLADYRIAAQVMEISPGPVITRYELNLAPGVKAARISTLARDLARSLSVVAVRVVEVIPGKPYVGLELPNQQRQTVYLREVLSSDAFRNSRSPLTIVLGKDIAGYPLVADLAKMPHVLVAGTTGSGKSVGVNAMILSILYKATPEEVRFIMIDPKMLELSVYEGIPHLLTEVVTDMNDAAKALRWCVNEMERRYKLMSLLGVRNLAGYNQQIQQAMQQGNSLLDPLWSREASVAAEAPPLSHLPYIVVIVDEFADLMITVGKKVEELIARLAQKARAAGIHLVLATQRPSVDVITGLIKANIPSRIAFTVSSKIDSRTILDQMGAESLLGMGDMLYLAANVSLPVRAHGAFVQDQEVHAVVNDWKSRGKPQYIDTILTDGEGDEGVIGLVDSTSSALDPLFDSAVSFVTESRRGSISSVQRKFKIGYNRAARLIEQMETEGIVSPPGHNGNREVRVPPSRQDFFE